MTPQELVPKYIVNREAVLRDPNGLEALSDFGGNGAGLPEALSLGADYLRQQLYGENLIFVATPDDSGNLRLKLTSSNLPLDGEDAGFIKSHSVDHGKGIISRSFSHSRDELVSHDLHQDKDYLEFSKSTVAVYAVPISSHGRVIGVFCIDSSDQRNFGDTVIMPLIHNFVELLMISLINTRDARSRVLFQSHAGLLELEAQRLRRCYHSALAAAWPLSPVLMQALLEKPTSISELQGLFPRQDLLAALIPLSQAGLVDYGNYLCTLTVEGERLAAVLREVATPSAGSKEHND
ncbi:MAG TPA: GAF domain-containing protein [Blastocatellia bacterium]|nr:GAF domain-containing protein [Blastocatellia bacterium]